MRKSKVQMWVYPDSKNLIKSRAAARGMSISDFVNDLINQKQEINSFEPIKKRKKEWFGL